MNYNPEDFIVVLKDSDGKLYPITGFTEDVPIFPKRWYSIEGDAVHCRMQNGDVVVITPVDMADFKEKYLDKLEDSIDSPFKINSGEIINEI